MKSYLLISTLGTLIMTLIGWSLFPNYSEELLAGMLLPWFNALTGFLFVSRRIFGTRSEFTLAAFYHIGVRLLFMLAVFTYLMIYHNLEEWVFIITLFFSYIYNSVLETIYLQRLNPKTRS